MDNDILLLPSSDDDTSRPDSATLQGSQGVLQTLLDLGEAFLGSEIGENDLQELEAKLSAARSRDYDTIRDLQKKIEELSGMGAMVSRLKDELREEKMKAQEEAEDLTQEMAELRYQLMERVDEEKELRARTEEASLRRISELEAQLKHAWCEISVLRGGKQAAEARLHVRTEEVGHIKLAFEEVKQRQAELILEKEETEKTLLNELHDFHLKVEALQKELLVANIHLAAAEDKVHKLDFTCTNLRKNDDVIQLDIQEQAIDRHLKNSKEILHDMSGDVLTSEYQKTYLEHEVKEMLDIIADFKLQLQLLAVEYSKADRSNVTAEIPSTDCESSKSPDQITNNTTQQTTINTNDKKLEPTWTVQEIVDIVDTITEEMTKLLRLLLKCSHSRKADLLYSLESRLQLWSNIPQKALPEKVVKNGVLAEWGDLVVDLVAQSRRELHLMQQKVLDLELEMESLDRVRDELNAAREEQSQSESYFCNERSEKDGLIQELEEKLEQTNKALNEAQERLVEQEDSAEALRGMLHRLEVDSDRLKSMWAVDKKRFDETMQEQHDLIQKERIRSNKEVNKLETMVEELQHRLNENEKELDELVKESAINTDAVVAAKLRRLDQKLKHSQSAEAELREERAELASQVVWLKAKLEEAERELEAENAEHVDALIQYEEERGLLEAELNAERHGIRTRTQSTPETETEDDMDVVSWIVEHEHLEKTLELMKKEVIEKDQLLVSQKEINRSLVNHSALLDSELLAVQQKLSLCESQANEMGSVIANLQEELLFERMEVVQAQEEADLKNKLLIKQEQEFSRLKGQHDELRLKLEKMQLQLEQSKKQETDVSTQVQKIGVELSLAKELVKSEVRFQKVLKQKEEQLGSERSKVEAAITAQKETELCLRRQTEELERKYDQLERERDDLKTAYAELETQFSRRSAFGK